MNFDLAEIATTLGEAVEFAGVLVLVTAAAFFTARFVYQLVQRSSPDAYHDYRRSLGRGILVGLELLVAGDIIRTVAIDPTLESVAVLGVIVLIRTFLSFALEVEINGRWPWQAAS